MSSFAKLTSRVAAGEEPYDLVFASQLPNHTEPQSSTRGVELTAQYDLQEKKVGSTPTILFWIKLSVLDPAAIGEPANPFATPLEILPEWYFYPTFQLLRTVPNKLLGVLLMAAVPAGLITVPFIENINKFQNPFRRPVATTVFLIGTFAAIWLGIGATLPIDISLTLGLF